MADHFRQLFPLLNVDPSMEVGQFPELNPNFGELSSPNFQSLMGFSHDQFLSQVPAEFPAATSAQEYAGNSLQYEAKAGHRAGAALQPLNDAYESKMKPADYTMESCSGNSSPAVSEIGTRRKHVS